MKIELRRVPRVAKSSNSKLVPSEADLVTGMPISSHTYRWIKSQSTISVTTLGWS
jgi:hypothetical protein